MSRRNALTGIGAGLVTIAAVSVFVAKPSETDRTLQEYVAARCVEPHSERGTRTWNNNIELPYGLNINVSADGSTGGLVLVRYPDKAVRHVTMLRDYVYPHDIRLTADAKTLWILNRGLGGGIWPEARLYEYDVISRILVRDLDVDPDDLPEPCPVTTAQAAAQRAITG
jgi:hypothetical protein